MAATQTSSPLSGQFNSGTKRKWNVDGFDDDALKAPFVIRGHSLSADNKGIVLTPQLLVPRSNLPLSFLAPLQGDESIPRMFRGNVKSLEAIEQQSLGHLVPNVLIARGETSINPLYAIERASESVYALCELASWVQLEDFENPTSRSKKAKRGQQNTDFDYFGRTRYAGSPHSPSKRDVPSHDGRVCSQKVRLLMKPFYKTTSSETKSLTSPPPDEPASPAQLLETSLPDIVREAPQCIDPAPVANLEEVLENLKRQYMETLYNSRASLAYFAKGPLTRPRGLLLQETVAKPSCQEVYEALRSCILSRTMIDTKYSSTVNDLVKDLPLDFPSEDELCGDDRSQPKIHKSKKRKKLGKNGLFPGEEEHIRKWFKRSIRNQADEGQNLSREERGKTAIAGQRSRETHMQITLILEVIALELSPPPDTNSNSAILPGTSSEPVPVAKSRKLQNLPELIDVLVERLCIWQSTDLDLDEQPNDPLKATSQNNQHSSSSCKTKNGLEDFCTQIIVPFYAARLPELSASICRKLGVPMGPSPKRPVLARTLSKTKRRDNEASHDKLLKRRKTLERVLTDDRLTRQGSVASLVRSNTDSAIPRIKREASEVSLSEVSATKGIKAMPRQYCQREVDLTAVSRTAEARLQRKQFIEQEKNAAIALLKKPNARLAVMDLLESKDQREAGAKARSRKPKNPVRNIFAQGVQVTATPQTNRHKDVFQPIPKRLPSHFEPSLEPEAISPSSDPKIPSSSIKANLADGSQFQETPVKRQETGAPQLGTVNQGFLVPSSHDTPVRGRAALQMPRVPLAVLEENVGLGSGCAETPSRGHNGKRRSIAQWKATFSKAGPSLTPLRNVVEKVVSATPSTKRASGKVIASTPSRGEKSIYESLGWDHDDVDDLI